MEKQEAPGAETTSVGGRAAAPEPPGLPATAEAAELGWGPGCVLLPLLTPQPCLGHSHVKGPGPAFHL